MTWQGTKALHLPASPSIACCPKLCGNVILAALLGHCLPCDIMKGLQAKRHKSSFSKTHVQLQKQVVSGSTCLRDSQQRHMALTHKLLIGVRSIGIRSVKVSDAQLQGPVYDLNAFLV